MVPLLFEKEKVLKQLKVETWLDLTEVLKETKENLPKENQRKEGTEKPQLQYIV
jgi:hypothetical protein